MRYRLGKTPARAWQAPGSRFRLGTYADPDAVPKPPAQFGHAGLIGMSGWDMLANDRYGDCVWAGAAHETMLLNKIAGKTVRFTDFDVLADYAAVTGFKAGDAKTDKGTDMQAAAAYRRKTGIVDADGKRHTIAAYLALDPGNLTQLYTALYLFGAVGIGLQLPSSVFGQTDRGEIWDVTPGAPLAGGHYVSAVGKLANGHIHVVSWGAVHTMTGAFLQDYCDEAVAYVSQESLVDQKSPEGFDYDTLLADLAALG